MNLFLKLKEFAQKIPYPIGRVLSHIPHDVRLGSNYSRFKKEMIYFDSLTENKKLHYVISKLNTIVNYAVENFSFYRQLYSESDTNIKTLRDFESLPIITKDQARALTASISGPMLINTSGTTGTPLGFYVDKKVWASEWAHLHGIWEQRSYKRSDLILTSLGRDLGKSFHRYNAVHNEILINPYMSPEKNIDELKKVFLKYPIQYLQGYPSSIYRLLRAVEKTGDQGFIDTIRAKIKNIFLSSEYPLDHIHKYFKDFWKIDYVSWFGHSEMCILAHDLEERRVYKPFNTYGYAEIHENQLIGTSFNNFAMPLIRYKNDVIVKGEYGKNNLLQSFKVIDGRSGSYLIDLLGNQIPATAFIAGRHHKIYEFVDYIQFFSPKPGELILFIVFKEECPENYKDLVNLDNFHFNVTFKIIKKPILTKNGKLKTLLDDNDLQNLEYKESIE